MTITSMNPMTYSNLGDLIPAKYDKKVRDDRRVREFWGKFAGPEGSQQPIIEKTDLKKEAGDRIHMETISELYKPGVSGETEQMGAEEKFQINRFTVALELYRHAVAVTYKGNSMAIIDSINRAVPKLGRYFANKYDDLTFAEILDPANASERVLYAGTATADDELSSSTMMQPDCLDLVRLAAERNGMLPIKLINTKQDNMVEVFGMVMSPEDWYQLIRNSTFKASLQDTLPRGYDHPLVTGAKCMWNGILIHTYRSINQGCHQGSPLRPEVAVTSAVTTGDAAITVGSSLTGYDYTKNFPQSGNFGITVMADGTNATEDLTVSCHANNYQFTIQGGTAAADHLVGTRIVYQKHRATSIVFGAETVARAWGEKDVPIHQEIDYQMNKGVGIMSTLGVAVIEDSAGGIPNSLLLRTYAPLPNLTSIVL